MQAVMIDFFGMYTKNLNLVDLGFLKKNVENFKEKTINGVVKYEGTVDNMKFYLTEHGLFVYGSPAKFTYGHNFQTLKHIDLVPFIERLSVRLNCDVRQMSLSRMDITDNLEMDHAPILYKRYMGNCQYLQRVGDYQHNGLNYQNGSREVVFYDKKIEARDKGTRIPPEYQDKNLWRYEYRLLENINSYLGGAVITRVDDLLDRDTYLHLIDAWEQMFYKIELVDVDAMRHVPYNPNLPYDVHLLACGIMNNGGLGVVLDDLQDQFYLGNLTARKLRYRKNKFKEAVEAYRSANNLPQTRKDELLHKLQVKAEENRQLV